MSSFNVLLILAFATITTAYRAWDRFINNLPLSDPYSNYKFLVNRPYPGPYAVTYEQPEADPFASYNNLIPFEQLPSGVPQRLKSSPTFNGQKEEFKDVIEDVLKLLIDQRLCEITNGKNGPITKRAARISHEDTPFPTKTASTTEQPTSFNLQQLSFLKDLKPEDIQQLIRLMFPTASALATNRTLPPLQGSPYSELTNFNVPSPFFHPAPFQMPVLVPSPYIQTHPIQVQQPFEHQQIISYQPFDPAVEAQFHLYNPYAESPVVPPIMLDRVPPSSNPFVYSLRIFTPFSSNQGRIKPTIPATKPNRPIQIESKPVTIQGTIDPAFLRPYAQGVGSPSKPPASSSLIAKPESHDMDLGSVIFPQSKILVQDTTVKDQVTSTEKTQTDLGTVSTNNVGTISKIPDEILNSTKVKADPVKETAKSASDEDSFEIRQTQPVVNEQLLEVFKTIREKLMKNNNCRIITPKRRALNEGPNADFIRNQNYQNLLSRHAIPRAGLLNRRHNHASKMLYHKSAPFHSSIW